MAKEDPMVDMALKRKNMDARKYHQEQCYMYAYGYSKKEAREYEYIDNKGVQKKSITFLNGILETSKKPSLFDFVV
ncbi:MAG: hypothetical protein SPL75_01780 [Bacilli bacterium]|nr:hypothetical protein [Bacilli bacterium]